MSANQAQASQSQGQHNQNLNQIVSIFCECVPLQLQYCSEIFGLRKEGWIQSRGRFLFACRFRAYHAYSFRKLNLDFQQGLQVLLPDSILLDSKRCLDCNIPSFLYAR